MVLSNYKCMYLEYIFEYRIPEFYYKYTPVMFSSNRIKIQEILLILQLETDYFSKLFISEMHSKQWTLQSSQRLPELLFYTKKSHRILQLQFYTCTLHYNPENSPSRIQFYMQKTKSSSSTTTTYRGQRDLHSRKKFYA